MGLLTLFETVCIFLVVSKVSSSPGIVQFLNSPYSLVSATRTNNFHGISPFQFQYASPVAPILYTQPVTTTFIPSPVQVATPVVIRGTNFQATRAVSSGRGQNQISSPVRNLLRNQDQSDVVVISGVDGNDNLPENPNGGEENITQENPAPVYGPPNSNPAPVYGAPAAPVYGAPASRQQQPRVVQLANAGPGLLFLNSQYGAPQPARFVPIRNNGGGGYGDNGVRQLQTVVRSQPIRSAVSYEIQRAVPLGEYRSVNFANGLSAIRNSAPRNPHQSHRNSLNGRTQGNILRAQSQRSLTRTYGLPQPVNRNVRNNAPIQFYRIVRV